VYLENITVGEEGAYEGAAVARRCARSARGRLGCTRRCSAGRLTGLWCRNCLESILDMSGSMARITGSDSGGNQVSLSISLPLSRPWGTRILFIRCCVWTAKEPPRAAATIAEANAKASAMLNQNVDLGNLNCISACFDAVAFSSCLCGVTCVWRLSGSASPSCDRWSPAWPGSNSRPLM